MAEICNNLECLGQFSVASVGGGGPGAKDLAIIECPHCGMEQGREMTSAASVIKPIYDEQHPKPTRRATLGRRPAHASELSTSPIGGSSPSLHATPRLIICLAHRTALQ